MTLWGLFLHFYQPPTQFPWVLQKITDECYRPLVKVFEDSPSARATVNINGILLEQLQYQGASDVVDGFRRLIKSGKWEVTGTAKYHVILPLMPEKEALRQIELQKTCIREYLAPASEPRGSPKSAAGLTRGFFPPEMCASQAIFPWIRNAGYEWALLSGTSCAGPWPSDFVGRSASGLRLLFRDEVISNQISFDRLAPDVFLERAGAIPGYVITAMDAETYGHHIPAWEKLFLAKAFKLAAHEGSKVRVSTLSGIVDTFASDRLAKERGEPDRPAEIRDASWSTSQEDLEAGVPYPLWKDPRNPIHMLQWRVTDLALEQVYLAESVVHVSPDAQHFAGIARSVLDAGLHSCQYWWAAKRPLTDVQMIYRGLWLLEEAVINATRAVIFTPGHESLKNDARARLKAASEASGRLFEALAAGA